jgi:hypothetical protein
MARKHIWLRKQDGSGAGVMYRTQQEADKFMKLNPDYVVESEEQTKTNQQAADAAVAVKAQAASEDKALKPTENKAR